MDQRHWGRALFCVLSLSVAACTGGTDASGVRPRSDLSGGTLRVVDFFDHADPFDPQTNYELANWELFRCCLLRTLLSYTGRPADRGGSELHPDLASAMPEVSDDGLTWTFHLKADLHYAPPFDDVGIVAGDIVRALERMGDPDLNSTDPSVSYNYTFYYSIIEGFDDYRAGRAASIHGLEVPDDHTLTVRLTAPAGDLGYLFALPASAPIPEGAADGHDADYGSFLVSSGPYMFEGADQVDYTLPPKSQVPASGYVLARDTKSGGWDIGKATLVRNPSWEPSTDALRPAYPDRIEIDLGGVVDFDGKHGIRPLDAAFDAVTAGRRDLVLDLEPPPDIAAEYSSDPELSDRLRTARSNFVTFVAMNLGEPPFEDIHVRTAVSLVVDKAELARRLAALDTPLNGVPATHIAPDSMESGLLAEWQPAWAATADQNRVTAARAEMSQSAYDHDGDGRCDDPVCSDVTFAEDQYWVREFFPSIRRDLAKIGITFTVKVVRRGTSEDHVALFVNRWAADFPDASDFFPVLFSVTGPVNLSLVGALPGQLATSGYHVRRVPSVDADIDRCTALLGQARVDCWAQLDLKLSEDIVPWVPILFETRSTPVSDRVIRYSFDQFVSMPALDRIALAPASG